jgi:hypothetical protein
MISLLVLSALFPALHEGSGGTVCGSIRTVHGAVWPTPIDALASRPWALQSMREIDEVNPPLGRLVGEARARGSGQPQVEGGHFGGNYTA